MSQILSLVFPLFIIIFLVLWVLTIIWTAQDIKERSKNPIIVLLSLLFVIALPLGGLIFYLLLRPQMTLDEKKYLDLERLSMVKELKNKHSCPSCNNAIEENFVVCPSCNKKIKNVCCKCGEVIKLDWEICPYCASRQTASHHGSKTSHESVKKSSK